jgi:hypothetical protein
LTGKATYKFESCSLCRPVCLFGNLVLLQRYGSAVRGVLDRDMTFVAVGGMLLLVDGVVVLWLER